MRRACVVLLLPSLIGGCAGGAALTGVPSGPVKLSDGSMWPAQYVNRTHPAAAKAPPISRKLWDGGHRFQTVDCHFMDEKGDPTRLTLIGVFHAAQFGLVPGMFGDLIDAARIQAAKGNFDRQVAVFEDAAWRAGAGDPTRVRAILQAAVEQDARCLRSQMAFWMADEDLSRSNQRIFRDFEGRPLVVTIVPNPEIDRKRRHVIAEQPQYIRNIITFYGQIAGKLNKRAGQTRVAVTAPPKRLPGVQRPVPPQPISPLPTSPDPVDRLPIVQPAPEPVRHAPAAVPTAITVDTAPLRTAEQEAIAAIAKIKEYCLLRANTNCP